MSVKDWDPAGNHGDVVEAVKSSGTNIKVFMVEKRAGAEYWILALDRAKSRVVGLMTESVES